MPLAVFDTSTFRVVCDECARGRVPELYGFVVHLRKQQQEIKDRKAKCLEHYAKKDPKQFHQIDGFIMDCGGDYIMHADKDGDCLMGCDTWELMHGADVRVLVPVCDQPKPQRAAQILRKIAMSIERDGLSNADAPPRASTTDEDCPF